MEKNLRNTQRSLKDVERLLKLDPTNTELLAQKQRLLQQELSQTEEKLKTLKTASEQAAESAKNYDAWKKAYDPIKKEIDETSKKISDLKKRMSEMEDAGEINTQEYKDLQTELAEATKKARDLRKSAKEVSDEFGNPISTEQYEALKREIISNEQHLKALRKEAGSSSATLAKVSKATESFGNKAKSAGSALIPVTTAITAVGTASVVMASNFEDAMSQAAGALNLPMSEMEGLRQLAIQTGQDTIFSATEAGNAITELAKGGLTEADIQAGALQTTMDLAASSGMELGDAANVVVQAMGAFGLSANQSAEAANALAGAAAASSTDVDPLTQGLSQCSAQANNAGWSIQETTAVLGRFADAGITGSDAGTSLKTMLQRLAAPTDEAAGLIEQLGIQTRDSSGNLLGASAMAEELQNKLGGLSSAERDAALQTIFGSDATRAATVMMNSGEEGLQKYIKATNDQEAAQRLANSQMGDTSRAVEEMKGSLETAAITIGESVAPVIENIAGFISDLADKFSSLPSEIQTGIVAFAAFVAALGPLLIIIGQISIGISAVSGAFSKLSGIGVVLSKGLGLITTAFKGLFALIAANPVVAIITAIIAVLVLLYTKCEWFRDGVNSIVSAVINFFNNLGENIVQTIQNAANTISNGIESIKQFFANLRASTSEIWNGILSSISNIAKNIKEKAVNAFNSMVSGIGSALSSLGGIVKSGFQSAIDFITSLPGKAISWGKDFINGLKDGIMSGVSGIVSAVKGIGDKIRSFLHFSRPDEGPLRDYETWMPDMIKGLSSGILSNIPLIESAMKQLSGTMVVQPAPADGIDYSRMAGAFAEAAGNVKPALYIDERSFKRGLRGLGVDFGDKVR